MLSIIVPTYNERDNVERLVERIRAAVSIPFEIVFVDDSRDDTPQILARLAARYPEVRFVHREDDRGLGTAVVTGFRLARGDLLAVMDADLQHPPEKLMDLVREAERGADVVVPSRFVPGGSDGGLSPFRKLVSWSARWLARLLLRRVRPITDPTSGFFLLRRSVIEGVELNPVGWKILIEVLVKGRYRRVVEIPYAFKARAAGESKMGWREQWEYLVHLVRLIASSPEDRRFWLYCLVGASGVVVNFAVYGVLVNLAHLYVPFAGALAAACAMMSNFLLNDRFTWRDARSERRLPVRAVRFLLVSATGVLISAGVLELIHRVVHYLLANLVASGAAVWWNFTLNNRWTWAGVTRPDPREEAASSSRRPAEGEPVRWSRPPARP
ncbi:glycosyltransferase [Thermaerobacter litoralis]